MLRLIETGILRSSDLSHRTIPNPNIAIRTTPPSYRQRLLQKVPRLESQGPSMLT
jgi:hypothetical protein